MDDSKKHLLYYSSSLAAFQYGDSHPFKPERASLMMELLNRYTLIYESNQEVVEPTPLTREQLLLFHHGKYLTLLEKCDKGDFTIDMLEAGIGNNDNPILPGIYDFSAGASGGTWDGAVECAEGRASFAFNPLGGFHHAGWGHAEGFCYINDIAVAIAGLLKRGLRIAYLDIDAHHGNGVQDAFYAEKEVLTISIHESGETLYPWGGSERETGAKEGTGYNINIPLRAESNDGIYLHAYNEIVPSAIKNFSPDILFLEVGGDSHRDDPLTHLNLSLKGYRSVLESLKGMGCPIVATGGGGYNVQRTAMIWALAWSVLCGVEADDHYAGMVGGMMFGEESKTASFEEEPFEIPPEIYGPCMADAERVVQYLKENVPLIKL